MNISLALRPHLKVLHYLFLPLLLLVASLCTQNTSALSFPTGWVSSSAVSAPSFRMLVGSNFTPWATMTDYSLNNNAWVDVNGIEIRDSTGSNLTIPANSIWTIEVKTSNCIFRGFSPGSDYSWAHFIGYELQTYDYNTVQNHAWTLYFYNSGNEITPNPINLGLKWGCTASATFRAQSFVAFTPANNGGSSIDYTSVLNDILDAVDDLNTTYSSLETQIIALNNKMQTQTEVMQSQYAQQRSEGHTAQSDANSSATSSSSDATSTGSTLLSGLTSLVAALNVSPAANCKIDMDMGNVDFGEADLCAISPPVQFQVISSLVVIGFAVPLSLAAAHKMVEMFRSFA